MHFPRFCSCLCHREERTWPLGNSCALENRSRAVFPAGKWLHCEFRDPLAGPRSTHREEDRIGTGWGLSSGSSPKLFQHPQHLINTTSNRTCGGHRTEGTVGLISIISLIKKMPWKEQTELFEDWIKIGDRKRRWNQTSASKRCCKM